MSVEFTCPNAGSFKRVPCSSPSLGLECLPEDRCGYCDDGWEELWVSECPEVQMSNPNAEDILHLLHLPTEDEFGSMVGSLAPEALPTVLQRIMVVVARPEARAHLVCDAQDHTPETRMVVNDDGMPEIRTGARVVDFGNTDESTLSRLEKLRTLLVWAHSNNQGVSWA